MKNSDSKLCATCGRTITWRKKWEKNWEQVRYCSDVCKKRRPSDLDHKLEETILSLLLARAKGITICPSEAARAVFGEGWETKMEQTRQAARRLVASGKVVITQSGQIVNPSTAKGPIRVRLA